MTQELAAQKATEVHEQEGPGLLEQIIREGKVKPASTLLDRLSREESPLKAFLQRKNLLESFWVEAVRMTNPEDWVLNRDREGKLEAMIAAEGARKVAMVYQIELRDLAPVSDGMFAPVATDLGNDVYSFRGSAVAYSATTGGKQIVEIEKRSDEDFTGRSVDAAGHLTRGSGQRAGSWQGDLQSAVLTGLMTKAVRQLCAMGRVPVRDLETAWKDTGKKVEDCRKGQGFGSSGERTSTGLAETGIADQVKALEAEVLKLVGGDLEKAKGITKVITSSKTFAGFASLKQITKEFQVKQAWANLKALPEYQAAHESRVPGQEG